jgi:copper oxidase (laccase) domain-containing protein
VGAGVVEQLRALEVDVEDLASSDHGCTLENPDLYSYRRQAPRAGGAP